MPLGYKGKESVTNHMSNPLSIFFTTVCYVRYKDTVHCGMRLRSCRSRSNTLLEVDHPVCYVRYKDAVHCWMRLRSCCSRSNTLLEVDQLGGVRRKILD
eukprot:sb/3478744/